MKTRLKILLLVSITFILAFGCKWDNEGLTVCDTSDIKFSTAINPIIQANCAVGGCHDGTVYTADFRTYQGVWDRVNDGTFRARVITIHAMPPVNKLSDCDYKKLQMWVDAGALNN
jgi:hypothetical protein